MPQQAVSDKIRILFIGDVVARPGREATRTMLPKLMREFEPDFVVANGENASGGMGITEKGASALFDCGVDVITLGNHSFRHKDAYAFLDSEPRIIRPANYLPSNPGRGWASAEKDGVRYGVVNLSGTLMLNAARSPFQEIASILPEVQRQSDLVLVDFHAETTSEKVAMGWYLDGKVCAVVGTHTHIPTADARILPGGTAYITDVGMTGARDSVIGVKKEQVLERFLTQMPVKFESADGDVWIMAALIEANRSGQAESIEPLMRPVG